MGRTVTHLKDLLGWSLMLSDGQAVACTGLSISVVVQLTWRRLAEKFRLLVSAGLSKPAPLRCRTTDCSGLNEALRRRGSMPVCLGREISWLAPKRGRPGRPEILSDAAIQFCISIKVLFGLALRQTIGVVESLLKLVGLDWPVPDHSTLRRRQ